MYANIKIPHKAKIHDVFRPSRYEYKDRAPQILSIQIAVRVESGKDSAYLPISRSLTK